MVSSRVFCFMCATAVVAVASWLSTSVVLGAIVEGSSPRAPVNCDADIKDPTLQIEIGVDDTGNYEGFLQPFYEAVLGLAGEFTTSAADKPPLTFVVVIKPGEKACFSIRKNRQDAPSSAKSTGPYGDIDESILQDQPLGPLVDTADVLTSALTSLKEMHFFQKVSLPDSSHVDTMNLLIVIANQPMNPNANSRLFDCCKTAKQDTIRNYLYDSNTIVWLLTSSEIADSYTNGLKGQSFIFHSLYDDGQDPKEKVRELYAATRCLIGGLQDQWGVSETKPWGGEISYLVDFKLLDSFRRGARPVDHSLSHWLYHFTVFNKPVTCAAPDDLLAVIEEDPLTQCTQKEDTGLVHSWWSIQDTVAELLTGASASSSGDDGAADQLLAMYNAARFTEWCTDPEVCPPEAETRRIAVIYTSEGPDASFPCDGMRYPFPSASDPVTDCIATGAPQLAEVIAEFTKAGVTPVVILSDDAEEDAETSWSTIMGAANGLFTRENGLRLFIHVDLAVKQLLFGPDDDET